MLNVYAEDWQRELSESLEQLTELLCGDELLSAYELQSSGLAPSLLQVLSPQANGKCECHRSWKCVLFAIDER